MKMLALDDEIVDMLIDDYDVDDMDAHDAVIAAKVLGLVKYDKDTETNAEAIYSDQRCWNP